MSKEIPTPYVWTLQPQVGAAAGASQDYSTRMNWLSAGNRMITRVNDIRDERNQLLVRQAALTETPRNMLNPRNWPASALQSPIFVPETIRLPDNEIAEQLMTNEGMQLAGGACRMKGGDMCRAVWCSGYPDEDDSVARKKLGGFGLQLNEQLPLPQPYRVRSDGVFQLAGGSRTSMEALSRQNLLALQTSPSVPRDGGLGTYQFVQEFVPSVYINPFSGNPRTYPDEFISNFDAYTNSVDGYA